MGNEFIADMTTQIVIATIQSGKVSADATSVSELYRVVFNQIKDLVYPPEKPKTSQSDIPFGFEV